MGVVSTGSITLYDSNDIPAPALSNEVQAVPSNADGSSPNLTGAVSKLSVLLGDTDITSLYSVAAMPSSGITGSLSGTQYTVSGMTVDAGYVDFTATRTGWPTLVKRFSLAKQKQGTPGATGPAGVDAPRCLGLYAYADRGSITDMISNDLAVLYSATLAERGIYQYLGTTWSKVTAPTSDQIQRCFVSVLDAVRQGYGVSSDYIGSSVAFETILSKFLYTLYLRLEGALYSGGYNEQGDVSKDAEGNDLPGAYIGGAGAFYGVGARFKSLFSNAMKTMVKYAGSWVMGTWGGETSVNGAASPYSAIATLPDGRVLCVYTRGSDQYLVQRIRATDGTWSAETVINSTPSYTPSLTALPDGRILCAYSTSANYYIAQRIRATDGTWGAETVINSALSIRPSLTALPDGRILCVYQRFSDDYLVQRIRATDGTWSAETVITSARVGSNTIISLPDGRVLCVYELNDSGYLAQRIRATDGTWGAETVINSALSIRPSLTALPDGRILCVYSASANYYLAQRIRATDGTWSAETVINSAGSDFSTLAILPDGRVLCVYTRGSDQYLVQRLDTSSYSSIPIGDFETDIGAGAIEVGQNSNGTYLKFSDGTAIVYRYFSFTTAGEYTGMGGAWGGWSWTFSPPVSFVSCAAFAHTNVATGGYFRTATLSYSSVTGAGSLLILDDFSDAWRNTTAEIFWIGRWK